jgi:PPIC-type PPIASE domain.
MKRILILKKNEIYKYIEQFGFKIAANKYSKSDTSKYGGDIGWIKGTRLSNEIKDRLSKIKIGEVSDPVKVPNGYLFLKVNNKKEIEEKYDLEKELKQQINFEKNRQLNQFSLNYYKKLKNNVNIYENK